MADLTPTQKDYLREQVQRGWVDAAAANAVADKMTELIEWAEGEREEANVVQNQYAALVGRCITLGMTGAELGLEEDE